jgi:hypothetical protein
MWVVRRSDRAKWYLDAKTGAGTARSNRPGKAARYNSLWDAWRAVLACGVPENWKPRRLKSRP